MEFFFKLWIVHCKVSGFCEHIYKKVVKVKQVCLHIFYVVALFCDHQRHLEICRGKFKIYLFLNFLLRCNIVQRDSVNRKMR